MDETRQRPKGAPFTLPEAAEYLGIKRSFLYKLTSQGRIPYFKPTGGKLYFTQEDLDSYLYRNRRAADYELQDRAEAALIGGRR